VIERMNDIYAGGNVRRHHNYPIVGQQDVAQHSWRMCMLYVELFGYDDGAIRWILGHDVAEYKTGDVPANAKWRSPILAQELNRLAREDMDRLGLTIELSETIFMRCKFVDRMEHMLFCFEQRRLGNRNVDRVFNKLMQVILKGMTSVMPQGSPPWELFYDTVREYGNMRINPGHAGGYRE